MQLILKGLNTVSAEGYSQFVRAAFIAPIRSVLIVDDDYPTVDEILTNQISGRSNEPSEGDKTWKSNPQQVHSVVEQFRGPQKPYLLDIHDAQNLTEDVELAGAKRLHQTDLLILDHELDRSKSGDGTLSLSIARQMMRNPHYNLVVVNSNDDPNDLFPRFVLGLMQPCVPQLSEENSRNLALGYEAADRDADAVAEIDLEGRLAELVQTPQYVEYVREPTSIKNVSNGVEPYTDVAALLESFGIPKRYWVTIVHDLLIRFEKSASAKGLMSKDDCGKLALSSGQTKWIRSDRAFITFVKKDPATDLLCALEEAILDWYPNPSRMFLSKLLATLDENGVRIQDTALKHKHALALWYKRLLGASDEELNALIEETVRLHSEELIEVVSPEVTSFAKELVKMDRAALTLVGAPPDEEKAAQKTREKANDKSVCDAVKSRHPGIDLSKQDQNIKSMFQHNSMVCSQKPKGWHLQTGHVFKLGDDYWVCLSPACDTVPSQISDTQSGEIGERLRFNAVKLHQNGQKPPSDASSGGHVFLDVEDKIEVFAFSEGAKSSPVWASLYAENRGKLRDGMKLDVSRVEKDADDQLVARCYETSVVAHLRYEYALNLINKLSANFSRIGLDFTG